jgi:subtilisin family serine protease
MATTLKQANAANAWPDLIVEPFGSPACDLDPTHPGDELAPIGLEAVSDAVDRFDQALEVASAGNRSESRRFYPAAFPSVLSVGALDTTADADGNAWSSPSRSGPAATFSNFGSWVRWWAPGVDLVTTHAKGLRFESGGPLINGYALVSGTSFTAPIVAGSIAQEMAANGWSADVARAKIEASGVKCSARLGGGTAVALVSVSSTPTSPATPGTPSAC